MPWSHPSPLDQPTPCIAASRRDRLAGTARCAPDGVRRKTGDHWLARALMPGPQGLDARGRPPSWGATQRWSRLSTRPPRWPWPARATGCAMLRRHGVGPQTRMRRVIGPPGPPQRHGGASRRLAGGLQRALQDR